MRNAGTANHGKRLKIDNLHGKLYYGAYSVDFHILHFHYYLTDIYTRRSEGARNARARFAITARIAEKCRAG